MQYFNTCNTIVIDYVLFFSALSFSFLLSPFSLFLRVYLLLLSHFALHPFSTAIILPDWWILNSFFFFCYNEVPCNWLLVWIYLFLLYKLRCSIVHIRFIYVHYKHGKNIVRCTCQLLSSLQTLIFIHK